MGMPAQAERRWTVREVRELIAAEPLASPRYELVNGELLVTPSPGPPHQESVARLLGMLRQYLEIARVGHALDSPSDIELEGETLVQPDVYVLPIAEWRRILRDGFPARELLLAIEVVSPSSGRHDRVRKRPLYQRGVGEYWIVDPDARLVELWRRGDARPEIRVERLEWVPAGAAAPFTVELPDFFARVFGEV